MIRSHRNVLAAMSSKFPHLEHVQDDRVLSNCLDCTFPITIVRAPTQFPGSTSQTLSTYTHLHSTPTCALRRNFVFRENRHESPRVMRRPSGLMPGHASSALCRLLMGHATAGYRLAHETAWRTSVTVF